MTKVQKQCYCAFCKNERRVYTKRHISFSEILTAVVLSTLFSFIFWQSLRPEALAFLVISLITMELSVHFRYRLGLVCPYCGFDPILYRRDKKAACEKVSGFMDQRKQDPMFYLSSKGYDKLARRKVEVDERVKELTNKAFEGTERSALASSAESTAKNFSLDSSSQENKEVASLPLF